MSKCEKCGALLIAPYDGKPYWCTECSYEEELKKLGKQRRKEERER
jgi:DNA-directed RNA polymerase subunit M/transcription elongation factor TFIIS